MPQNCTMSGKPKHFHSSSQERIDVKLELHLGSCSWRHKPGGENQHSIYGKYLKHSILIKSFKIDILELFRWCKNDVWSFQFLSTVKQLSILIMSLKIYKNNNCISINK